MLDRSIGQWRNKGATEELELIARKNSNSDLAMKTVERQVLGFSIFKNKKMQQNLNTKKIQSTHLTGSITSNSYDPSTRRASSNKRVWRWFLNSMEFKMSLIKKNMKMRRRCIKVVQ